MENQLNPYNTKTSEELLKMLDAKNNENQKENLLKESYHYDTFFCTTSWSFLLKALKEYIFKPFLKIFDWRLERAFKMRV